MNFHLLWLHIHNSAPTTREVIIIWKQLIWVHLLSPRGPLEPPQYIVQPPLSHPITFPFWSIGHLTKNHRSQWYWISSDLCKWPQILILEKLSLGAFEANFKVSAIYKLFFSFCSDHFKLVLQLHSQANKCSKQISYFLQSQLYNFKQINLKL